MFTSLLPFLQFAVLYGARANTGLDRMKIINTIAKSVPAPHKVDLSNPEMSIVVEIVKVNKEKILCFASSNWLVINSIRVLCSNLQTVCLIGVVEKYKELAKYNLRQLTSTN